MPGTGRASSAAARLGRCAGKAQLHGAFPPATLAEFCAALRALVADDALPRDAEGRLRWPRLRAFEREAIKLAVGSPYRTGRRLRGELLTLQFVASRQRAPALSVIDFLENSIAVDDEVQGRPRSQ